MHAPSTGTPAAPQRELWLLSGAAAGIFGILGTLVTDIHLPEDGGDTRITMDMVGQIDQQKAHFSIVFGFIAVACMLVFAAAWRRHLEQRFADSTAVRVVSQALTAAAGALTLGYGWKGATAIYHHDGMDGSYYDNMGLYVYYMLNDFGSYIGWFGVTVAAGAFIWLAFRERVLPLWVGILSCLPVLAVIGITGATGLPGFPGVVSPIWLTIACLGLYAHQGSVRSRQ